MGWLRLVGSLKVKVSNAKELYKRDDILQKRRYSAKETYNFKELTNRSHPRSRFIFFTLTVFVYSVCL